LDSPDLISPGRKLFRRAGTDKMSLAPLDPFPPSFQENDLSRNSQSKGVGGESIRQLMDRAAAPRSHQERFRRLCIQLTHYHTLKAHQLSSLKRVEAKL
jgi:hypothetical protein